MRIRAVFIGTNKSAGFLTGREYILQVLVRTSKLGVHKPEIVDADPPFNQKTVLYSSWDSFWRNWKKL